MPDDTPKTAGDGSIEFGPETASLLGKEDGKREDATRPEGPGPASLAPGSRVASVGGWRSALSGASALAGLRPERIEVGPRLREEAGRVVHSATDLDLAREVEIHFEGPGSPPGAFERAAGALCLVAGPCVPAVFEIGTDLEGRPFFLATRPEGEPLSERLPLVPPRSDGAGARREILSALARVARALDRAHAAGLPHLGISPRAVHVGRHGQATLTGWASPCALAASWGEVALSIGALGPVSGPPAAVDPGVEAYLAPELARGSRPGPAADVYALGVLVSAVAFGVPYRPVVRRRYRLLAGVPPAIVAVIRTATERRPSHRYPSAGELAADLELALAGEPTGVERAGLFRRAVLVLRRHPSAAAFLGLVSAVLALGAVRFALEIGRQRRIEEEGDARRAQEALARAGEELEIARAAAGELAIRLEEERYELEIDREQHLSTARPGSWGPAALERTGSLEASPGPPSPARRGLAREVHLLAGRVERVAAAAPDEPRARALADEAARLAAASLLPAIEIDLARALFDEERGYSSRAVAAARATLPLSRRLSRGTPSDAAAFRAEILAAPEPWREVAEGLARLLEVVPVPSPEERRRIDVVLGALAAEARLEVVFFPAGIQAFACEVDASGPSFELRPAFDLAPGEARTLPVGEWLFILSDGAREVRRPVLLARGETFPWRPQWPGAFPPGDYVYVPAGSFRAGGRGENAGPFRTERVDRGYFIGRTEVTLAEYLEFLADLLRRAGREALDEVLPQMHTPTGFQLLVDHDLAVAAGYEPEMPIGGVSAVAAARYAEWLTRRSGGAWRYSLPTEAEWEYAARGAGGRDYAWGDGWLDGRANVLGSRPGGNGFVAAGEGEDRSLFGLLHATGNVFEWTRDEFAPGLVVVRGASFTQDRMSARLASRDGLLPHDANADGGFRLVATPGE